MSLDKFAKHKKAMKGSYKGASAERKNGSFDMPYPIKGGVAKLSEVKMDEWEDKDNDCTVDIVKIEGVIVVPSEHKGKKVQISHFLRETQWRTMEECYDELIADLRDCGVDVTDLDKIEKEVERAVKLHKAFNFETLKRKDKIYCKVTGAAKTEETVTEKAEEKTESKSESADYGEDPFK